MLSTSSFLLFYFTTGLTVGFGHCLGMCGPIVIALNLNQQGKRGLLAQSLYHYGRITTYAIIGGFMGATGSFTMVASRIESIQKIAMIASGLLIVAMGLGTMGMVTWGHAITERFNFGQMISKGFRTLSGIRSPMAYYPLGLLFGLLPCGPVYTALLGAARVGMEVTNIFQGVVSGIGLMVAFGLGTIPALLLVTKIADWGIAKYRQAIYKVGSLLMIALGIYFVVNAINY
jgi:sulfite exporter TauE/SafE